MRNLAALAFVIFMLSTCSRLLEPKSAPQDFIELPDAVRINPDLK